MSFEYLTDIDGNKKAVVVPIEEFREFLEDLDDLAIVAERRNEVTMDHSEVEIILKKYAGL